MRVSPRSVLSLTRRSDAGYGFDDPGPAMRRRCELRRCLGVLLVLLSIGCGWPRPGSAQLETGTLVLVGDILRSNHPVLWKRIFDLASRDLADLAIVAAANSRPKLYGGFAKRALERYGAFVELLPVALDPDEFGIPYQQAVSDRALVEKVREGGGVFFVGGAPQRLAHVLLDADGSPTPMAKAIADVYAAGGIIVGGIPGPAGVHTGYDAMSALERGRFQERHLYRGLGLLAEGWYVDQHFFTAGRFAETLVAMRQLGLSYGLGIGANTAAVVEAGHAEVVGEEGVMVIDLSGVAPDAGGSGGFSLRGARLSYLDYGDRFDMHAKKAIPHASKIDGFEMEPGADGPSMEAADAVVLGDVFARGRLVQLMREALDGAANEAIGLAFRDTAGIGERGYRFRLYTGPDSVGWLSADARGRRFTILNIQLDVTPVTRKEINELW